MIIATTFFCLTRFGDWLLKLSLNIRKPTRKEKHRYEEALNEMLSCIQSKFGKQLKLKVYVTDQKDEIAYAINNSVVFSKGLLKVCSDDQIKGILAHEVGHIFHGDTKQLGVIVVSNFYARVLLRTFECISNFLFIGVKDGSIIIQIIFLLVGLLFFIPLMVCAFANFFLSFLYQLISRKKEYRADQFAVKVGTAEGLCSYLELMEDFDIRGNGFIEKYMQSHPPTALRVEKIEDALESSSN